MPYQGASPLGSILSPAKDSFSGDGSTTAFTIGTSGRTQNDLLVSVNGVLFHPGDDYSSSGTTITMAHAPDAGAEIRVRYLPI